MKKALLFIHGYGSDRNSHKFQDLKTYFAQEYNCQCLEWVVFSDIPYLLNLVVQKSIKMKNVIIVGDSMGGNLAYQLLQIRNRPEDKLVLFSPLLDTYTIKIALPFPEIFCHYLVKISNLENALVIVSKKDEVIDQQFVFDVVNKKFT